MIEVSELTKRYGPKTAVDELSFTVRPGRVTGFLGPNGAGKTTTLRILLGLVRPTAGTATVLGRPFRDRPRGLRDVGALLDAGDVHGGRTARGHLRFLARGNGLPRGRVEEVLDEVGLTDAAGRRIAGYSLRMRQRLGIAAALLGDPPVLVFDEPLNGLDPEGVWWVRGLFRRLADEGRTVFVSSHLMSEMENTADDLVVIGRGALVAAEPLAAFAARAAAPVVTVRTPEPEALGALLTAEGASVERGGTTGPEQEANELSVAGLSVTELSVSGLSEARIAEVALRHGLLILQLTPRTPSLEAAFRELTADHVEHRTTPLAPPPAADSHHPGGPA
ncbi:ATP-binding cassette domain-containing protein [Streptomyces triticagri]|uniref:ATP-binding cassette domain-containing protein n=1 Tax=Streptomyces triticagri TaxID=2293568 RepID=UPI0018F64614|nr:ATP-binding cassette domain-containing protein [Streptomyces triticagri]